MGCGVACVANRLQISYKEALKMFERPEYAKTVGYKCKYIVEALRNAGQDVRLKHIKERDREYIRKGEVSVPIGTIVFLERSGLYPLQHYLLKTPDGWIDPWINMHDNPDVKNIKAGVRKHLPGRPYYAIL